MVMRFNHTSSCTDSNFSFSHTTRLAYHPEAWWMSDTLTIQTFIDLCKVKDLDEFRQDNWYILQLSINSFPQSNIEESTQDVLIVMNNIEAAWHHNRVVSMLAYDKTGFFNSSPTPFWSQQCMHYISLSQLLNGCYLFLQNRKATICLDGKQDQLQPIHVCCLSWQHTVYATYLAIDTQLFIQNCTTSNCCVQC